MTFDLLQALIQKTPYLLLSSFLIQMGQVSLIRTSTIHPFSPFYINVFYVLLNKIISSLDVDLKDYWWPRQTNSQQKRFVYFCFYTQFKKIIIIFWGFTWNSCRWTRLSLSPPLTPQETLTTSRSATLSHMETRRRNPNVFIRMFKSIKGQPTCEKVSNINYMLIKYLEISIGKI